MVDPRRQTWSRGGLGGRRRSPVSTSRSVGQPLALDTLHGQIGAGLIVHAQLGPVGVTEIELGQIPGQMRLGHMLIGAVDAPLEDGEEPFNGVGVNVATDVFTLAIGDGAMAREVISYD
jgi:hypothetical protein